MNGFMPAKRRFDFTQFNAVPPHLRLLVDSAQKLDIAVGTVASEIACFVKTIA